MNKKFRALIMLALAMATLTACGEKEATSTTMADPEIKTEVAEETKKASEPATPAVTELESVEEKPAEPEEPIRDLGGMEIVIGAWSDITEPDEKSSSHEEATWEFHNDNMEKYNYTFSQKAVGAWNEILETFSTSTLAGEPKAELFRIHANFKGAARNSGLAYDLATLDSLDLSDPKWSQTLIDIMTVGDSVYGITTLGRPTKVLFFNKRLFEESGLDPDLLYDLQASGDWTWDAFMEVSEKLTKDTDNDGVNDIYAFIMNQNSFAQTVMFSNDCPYVGIDENGKYYNNLLSPESLEALEWCAAYWATDYDGSPAHWNGHKEMFYSGQGAMYLGSEWECTTLTPDLMTDDWGMVAFPKGPNADGYMAVFNDDAYIIPASFTKEEAENIAFAYNLWTTPPPGYDDPEAWKTNLYPLYRDERAIEETMAMFRSPGVGVPDNASLGVGININAVVDTVFWNEASVIEAIESQKGIWQTTIDKKNAAVEAAAQAEAEAEAQAQAQAQAQASEINTAD